MVIVSAEFPGWEEATTRQAPVLMCPTTKPPGGESMSTTVDAENRFLVFQKYGLFEVSPRIFEKELFCI